MQNYNELFSDAISLSKKLGLEVEEISLGGKPLVAEWLMYELGPKIAEHFTREGFIKLLGTPHGSIRLHHLFKPIIDELLNVKSVITTGYVKVENDAKELEEFGNTPKKAFEKALQDKELPEKLHNWITLPSGEIIDLAFMTIYGSLYHEESLMGNLLAKSPKDLTGGMEFCPQLVGEAFYEKCGFDFKINFAALEEDESEEV